MCQSVDCSCCSQCSCDTDFWVRNAPSRDKFSLKNFMAWLCSLNMVCQMLKDISSSSTTLFKNRRHVLVCTMVIAGRCSMFYSLCLINHVWWIQYCATHMLGKLQFAEIVRCSQIAHLVFYMCENVGIRLIDIVTWSQCTTSDVQPKHSHSVWVWRNDHPLACNKQVTCTDSCFLFFVGVEQGIWCTISQCFTAHLSSFTGENLLMMQCACLIHSFSINKYMFSYVRLSYSTCVACKYNTLNFSSNFKL